MKNLINSIVILFFWCSLSSSGCGDSGGGGGNSVQNVPPGNNNTGQGGSLARFTIANNCLYALHNDSLKIFKINSRVLDLSNQIYVGRGIETIYPFGDNLFIAGNNGMYGYSITDPIRPINNGYVEHVTGCDPVVTNNTHAFLTIHGGTSCRGNINELQVYQLKNPFNNSVLLTKVQLTNPLGLGLNNNKLFVCDRGVGIKIFDITTPAALNQFNSIPLPSAKDLVIRNNILICHTEKGVNYYDVADATNCKFLSAIN